MITKDIPTIITAFPRESGHWYNAKGELVERVLGADGKSMVHPDVRHAAKYDLFPSVTMLTGQAHNEGLQRHLLDEASVSGYTTPRIDGEEDGVLMVRLRLSREEHAKTAANIGIDFHGQWARYWNDGIVPTTRIVKRGLAQFRRWAQQKQIGYSNLRCEVPFCFPGFGCGGTRDMVAPSFLGDLKCRDLTKTDIIFDSDLMQLAAYTGSVTFDGLVVATVVMDKNTGEVFIKKWTLSQLNRGWCMFKHLLGYWYAKTGLWEAKARQKKKEKENE